MKLPVSFYVRNDVVQIAKDLLGKVLFTKINGIVTAGIITETEAYAGIRDRASHAYNDRRTARTEVIYAKGGTAYVYLCYGVHHLFNVVTNKENIPHAVLVRAIKPFVGTEIIFKRRKKMLRQAQHDSQLKNICKGPGTISQGLGIRVSHTGENLLGKIIWIEDKGIKVRKSDIIKNPRIGVDYAGADALLPYRFTINV